MLLLKLSLHLLDDSVWPERILLGFRIGV